MALAGKYLKSREEQERLSLQSQLNKLCTKITFAKISEFIKKAESNKEYLGNLMILNSEKVAIYLNDNETYEMLNHFIGKALLMKNSYVRYQAVDFIGKHSRFKENHLSLLKMMAIEDKNTHIKNRLQSYL